MTITTTALGPNSVKIDYTNTDTITDIMNAMHTEIVAKGWTDEDGSWWISGTYLMVRTYSHVNEDGVSKKYFQLRYQVVSSNNLISAQVFFDYNPATKTGTAFKKSELGITYSGLLVRPNYGGAIIMSTHARWCFIHSSTTYGDLGTDNGTNGSFIGIGEIKCAVPDDDHITYPNFAYLNGFLLQGTLSDASSLYGCFSVGKSIAYTNHINNFGHTMCVCPLGVWGHVRAVGASLNLGHTISSTPNKVNNKNFCFDVGAILDSEYAYTAYFKGNFYGLKIMNSSLGVLGDIVRAKADDDYMMDGDSLTDKDFLIFPCGSFRWGVPA